MSTYSPGAFSTLYETALGQRLWAFVNESDNVVRMETATSLERPAVEGLEETLLEKFGDAVLDDRVKQMVGHMVRQVMERRGYVIAVQNVKLSSGAPFSRATRYKRRDDTTYYVFRHPTEPRAFALTADRNGARLPSIKGKGQWSFWKSFHGALRARVVFGIEDEAQARADIEKAGYHMFRLERLLRVAS